MKIGKISNSQYGIVNLFITITMIIWFVTGLMAANVLAPYMVPVVIIGTALVSLVILVFIIIEWLKKVKPTKEYEDERSDMCSLKATRNGFIIALISLAIYMIIGQMAPTSLYRIQALQAVFGLTVAAYTLSYVYYKGSFQGLYRKDHGVMTMSGKMFGFKGSLLPYVNMFSLFLILAALAMTGRLDQYFVVGMVLYTILLLAVGGYLESRSKYRIDKLWDERKARYDALAARNGYVFAMVAIGVLSMFYALGQSQVTMLLALMNVNVLITLVQFISYTYYLSKDAA